MSKYSFRVVQRYHVYVMDNFGNDVAIHYQRVNIFISQSH